MIKARKNYFNLSKNHIVLRGVWEHNGWTIIYDPEMVDAVNDVAMKQLSRTLKRHVLTFTVLNNTGTYSFAKYNSIQERGFMANDGQVKENFGNPLKEETGLNINENISEDDIRRLINRFGVDPSSSDSGAFTVVEVADKN